MSIRSLLKKKATSLKEGGEAVSEPRKRQMRQTAAKLREQSRRGLRSGAKSAKEQLSQIEMKKDVTKALATNQKIAQPTLADRARRAADARAPIDAELDPSGDPRAMEAFASGAMMGQEPQSQQQRPRQREQTQTVDDDPLNVATGFGMGGEGGEQSEEMFPFFGGEDDDDDPLMFDDDFMGGGR